MKAHLSRALRDVQSGETILVTDRGRVVAELRRPDATGWSASPSERALARLAVSGALRLAERAPPPYNASPIRSPAGLAAALLAEERAER